MALITILTFDDLIEAHLMKATFENEGIPCVLFDESIMSLAPIYNITVGGIKLKINDTDTEKAKQVLEAFHNSKLTNEEGEVVCCPKCESEEVYNGFKSMKGSKGVLSAIISFSLLIFPLYYKTVNKCKACDHEF